MLHFFGKRHKEIFPFHQLERDVHSHILPGLDDGAKDEVHAESLIKGLLELGYSKLTATPHVMCDMFDNDADSIVECRNMFVDTLHKKGWELSIEAAAEYLVDEQLEQLLKEKSRLLTIRNNLVLIEVSFIEPPHQLNEIIFEMMLQGYVPVFAHPERYSFYSRDRASLQRLHEMGCLMQCNLLSFGGYYGKSVQQFAEWIAQQGWVRMLGTDLHHERHLEGLRNLPFTKSLQTALGSVAQ
ncbi:MAG: tyrosine-protein phosphatase [Bacteroidota bacterium]